MLNGTHPDWTSLPPAFPRATRDFLWIISSSLYSITSLFTYKVGPPIKSFVYNDNNDQFFYSAFLSAQRRLWTLFELNSQNEKKKMGQKSKERLTKGDLSNATLKLH